jgi:opacity protein-like surface antigen
MNVRFGWLLSAMLLLGATSAAAQRIDTPYRFYEQTQAAGLTVGYISTDKGSVGLGPESGMAYGGRYHIRLSGPFFLEGEALYFPTTRAVLDTSIVVADSTFEQVGEADIAIALVQASLRFQITGQRTWNGILPFVLLGAGLAVEAKDDDEANEAVPSEARFEFGTTFAGQLGAGIEFFPVQGLAIRIDARNILWQLKTPQALQQRDIGRTLPAEEWTNNITASVGISIHF